MKYKVYLQDNGFQRIEVFKSLGDWRDCIIEMREELCKDFISVSHKVSLVSNHYIFAQKTFAEFNKNNTKKALRYFYKALQINPIWEEIHSFCYNILCLEEQFEERKNKEQSE